MRALWVSAHPDSHSLTGHLRTLGVHTLRSDGWQVTESDLYAMRWDPVLHTEGGPDVEAEQRKLLDADLVVLQFPLWWYGMPAIMKGWIDRVFEREFAYDVLDPVTGRARKYGDGGLVGRRALTVVTAGDRPGSLGPRGPWGALGPLRYWPCAWPEPFHSSSILEAPAGVGTSLGAAGGSKHRADSLPGLRTSQGSEGDSPHDERSHPQDDSCDAPRPSLDMDAS